MDQTSLNQMKDTLNTCIKALADDDFVITGDLGDTTAYPYVSVNAPEVHLRFRRVCSKSS